MPTETEKTMRTFPFQHFREPFTRSRPFPLLWLGQLISILGNSVTTVILPVVVYSLTGSTTVMGLVMAVYMLPNVLMLPFSGWVVDRYDRVGLMMLSDIGRFCIMTAMAILAGSGSLSVGIICGMIAVYGLMDGLFQPAYSAVRNTVFTPDIRNAANALTQLGNQGVRLIGPALGGLLVTSFSAALGFGLDAATYVLSLLCLLALRRHLPWTSSALNARPSSWKTEILEGVKVLKTHPWLWITILVFSFINICFQGILIVLVPWLFNIRFGFAPYVYGIGVACGGGGAILAAVLFGLRKTWRKRGLLAYGGILLGGLALLAMPFTPSPAGLAILYLVEGFGFMVFGLIWETSLQELVPEEAFGRVVSLDYLGSFALLPVGFFLVGWGADLFGGVETLVCLAGAGLAVVAAALAVPGIRRFD